MSIRRCPVSTLKLVALFPTLLLIVGAVQYFIMMREHINLSANTKHKARNFSNFVLTLHSPGDVGSQRKLPPLSKAQLQTSFGKEDNVTNRATPKHLESTTPITEHAEASLGTAEALTKKGISKLQESPKLNVPSVLNSEIPTFAHVVDNDPARPQRPLSPFEEDGGNVLLTIRTTVSLHKKRLPLLMETWLTQVNCSRIYLVTDGGDPEIETEAQALGLHYHIISCGKTYKRDDLCCKSGSELAVLFLPGNEHYEWLCHVDDDIYVSVKNLATLLSKFDPSKEPIYLGKSAHRMKTPYGRYFLWAFGGMYCLSRALLEKAKPHLVGGENFARTCKKFQQPEDVSVGATIGILLNYTLTGTNLINPHCMYLGREVDSTKLHNQVAIAYGFGMLKFGSMTHNVVHVPDALFTIDEDQSQFRSLHCHLYPETPWCLEKKERNTENRLRQSQLKHQQS